MKQIDCACLIHDVGYSWEYVEKLYNSLCRNLTPEVRLHVYTERNRPVPKHMIHHALEEWPGVAGPKRSWWYKIQLFNPAYHQGPLLYLDLDTVICGNIDWIWQSPKPSFWAVRDFKYLFRTASNHINSSVMWFDPVNYAHVYQDFDPELIMNKKTAWHGDQDYIQEKIPVHAWRYFDTNRVKSWRWELFDGGYNFRSRSHRQPGTGTTIPDSTSLIIFHGKPKPHECTDPVILQHWC